MRYVSLTIIISWLLLLCSNQPIVANGILTPKLSLNKTEIDYCSSSNFYNEFVLTIDLGTTIIPADSLFFVNLAFAYNKEKVVIDMPLKIGTLAEQFTKHLTVVWANFDYKYNYYNFQAYTLNAPVSGKKPLIKFKGRFLTDTIDETDFSMAVFELSEEFKREYSVGKEDTVKLYARPVEKGDRIVKIEAKEKKIIFNENININKINYDLSVANLKHFESFFAEFEIKEENKNYFEINDFKISEMFNYEIIEQNKTKLLLELKVKEEKEINSEINDICELTIVSNAYEVKDTIKSGISSNIKNINKSSCSMIPKNDFVELVSEVNGSIEFIENNEINIDYNNFENKLSVFANSAIKYVRILNILGQQIIEKKCDLLANKVELNLNNINLGVYLLEIIADKHYTKKLIIN